MCKPSKVISLEFNSFKETKNSEIENLNDDLDNKIKKASGKSSSLFFELLESNI